MMRSIHGRRSPNRRRFSHHLPLGF
jgi:hypothetical protein